MQHNRPAQTSGAISEDPGSTRNPYLGLSLWIFSMAILYIAWAVIITVVHGSAGSYPVHLMGCFYVMYFGVVLWSFAATRIFRAESRKFVAAHSEYSARVLYSERVINIISITMVCCPFLMIVIFYYTASP
jgi:hypothetical protein